MKKALLILAGCALLLAVGCGDENDSTLVYVDNDGNTVTIPGPGLGTDAGAGPAIPELDAGTVAATPVDAGTCVPHPACHGRNPHGKKECC